MIMEPENIKKEGKSFTFTKKLFTSCFKASHNTFSKAEMLVGLQGDDLTEDTITVLIKGWFFERLSETKQLNYECDPPKFLDWLLRRRKVVHFTLDVKDLLLNPPPKTKNGTIRIYEVTKK